MTNLMKNIIRSAFGQFGLDVTRRNPSSSPTLQTVCSLREQDIDMVLDVGANKGQFASGIRAGGYTGNIVSFEPLSAAHDKLSQVSRSDSKWEIHTRCALGDRVGEAEINIAGNSASSSLLPMLESHLSAAPHTAYIGKESVPLATLDSIAAGYVEKSRNPFLKIDTQGFELQVLEGARNILPNMRGILLELSLVPLYDGQHLWEELIGRLKDEGFTLWAIQPGLIDRQSGRTLQVDGLFFRL